MSTPPQYQMVATLTVRNSSSPISSTPHFTRRRWCARGPHSFSQRVRGHLSALRPAADSHGSLVCAIASRFYNARPELHAKLSDLARKLAFSVPAQGYKSVEIVQAYLLNTLWGCGPVERYEQDRTWMLLGMAIRFVAPSAPFPGH